MEIKQLLERLMVKYFNYILFSLLLSIFFLFGFNKDISTSLQTILPNSENKELLNEFLKFKANKKIYIAVKGFDKKALNKLNKIENRLDKLTNIKKDTFRANKNLKGFKEEYYLYFQNIDKKKLENLDVRMQINKIYEELISSFLVSSFNKKDPLEIFENTPKNINIKNGKLFIKDYGYLTIYTIDKDIFSINEYKKIYKNIKFIENEYTDIKTFSSIYYFVENSKYIKDDATKIALIATIFLLCLYILILKNLHLLINTILTLLSSALFASISLILIYKQISVFVLVFGLSISTIAIDYMFHNYFHQNYNKKKGFNKEVFLGFVTTFLVFFILSFTNFKLITQISYFSMVSLISSYVIFSFIFPKVGFKFKETKFLNLKKPIIEYRYFFVFSIIAIGYFITTLSFNFDIKSLDYDNQKLKQTEIFFKNSLNKNNTSVVLIKANSINELVYFNEKIKEIDSTSLSPLDNLISKEIFLKKSQYLNSLDLRSIKDKLNTEASNIGFKQNYFKDAYKLKRKVPKYELSKLQSFGIDIEKFKDSYISYVSISGDKKNEIENKNYIYPLSLRSLFQKNLKKDINKIIYLGTLSFITIIILLLFFTRKSFFYALNFILFPLSLILMVLSTTSVNILHLFMVFIIIAISIDYAIYSTKSDCIASYKAILFSSLSSFAGFAVLIFSNTASLFSIGIVASFGIIGILILTLFQKAKNEI